MFCILKKSPLFYFYWSDGGCIKMYGPLLLVWVKAACGPARDALFGLRFRSHWKAQEVLLTIYTNL